MGQTKQANQVHYFVGIDISKKTLDAAITQDGRTCLSRLKVENTATGFKQILKWSKKHLAPNQSIHFCTESTGTYGAKLISYLQEETDYTVSNCNPFKISSFADAHLKRTKTDKADAMLIATFAATMNPQEAIRLSNTQKKLKETLRYIRSLIQQRTAETAKLDHFSDPSILEIIQSNIRQLDIHIKDLYVTVDALKESDESIKKNHDLLVSIPSISTKTAMTLLTEMIPQEPGSICRKAQTAHAGLAPSIRQSGTSVYSCKLTRFANKRLKSALYFPTLNAIRFNPLIKKFYTRLLLSGKSKMTAIVACMRKLLHICIGVLNNQSVFDPNFACSCS